MEISRRLAESGIEYVTEERKKDIIRAFVLGLSLAVFVVTCSLENYITAIAWALPAVIVGSFFCGFVMFRFDEITRSRGPVPLAGGIVLGVGGFAVLVWGMRERKRDIQ